MIAFLSEGAAGMDRAARQLASVGKTLNDFDVASVDRAGDAMNLLGKSMDLLTQQIAVGAAPAVNLFAQSVTQLVGSLQGGGGKGGASLYDEATKFIANKLQDTWHGLVGDPGPVRAGMIIDEINQRHLKAVNDAAARSAELRDAMQNLANRAAAAADAPRALSDKPVGVAALSVRRNPGAVIEAINKARLGSGKGPVDVLIKIQELNRQQLKVLNEIQRERGRAPILLPANLRRN
jgi:hypothetical protein